MTSRQKLLVIAKSCLWTNHQSLARAGAAWFLSCTPNGGHSLITANKNLLHTSNLYYASRSLGYVIKPKSPSSLDDQTRPIAGCPGARGARWGTPPGNPDGFMERNDPLVGTIYENFLRGRGKAPNHECMGRRNMETGQYEWITYNEVNERVHWLGSGLIALGANAGQSTAVGVYARSCPEWDIASLATSAYSQFVVSMYDSMSSDSITYILRQGDIRYLVVESLEKVLKLIERAEDTPDLKFLILIESSSPAEYKEAVQNCDLKGIRLLLFSDVLELGRNTPQALQPCRPEDIYMVCYTSGTTGDPKGALISHRAIMAVAGSFQHCTPNYVGIRDNPDDKYTCLAFLPSAHMFEQLMHALMFHYGSRVGYFSGDVARLAEDAQALQPTTMAVVPRLLNRLHDGVQNRLASASWVKRKIFDLACWAKLRQLKSGSVERTTIWDRVVFREVQASLGGKIEVLITGSAPIDPEVLNLCRVMLSCQIFEGYGQTECCACATGTHALDFTAGHVGAVFPHCHIRLADVPEMDYYAVNNEGEVCIRGPGLMDGYFKEPEKTKQAITEDGWLLTDDIGRWLPSGVLQIIDRKKHLFKLSQGEFVAPEKVETIYMKHPMVEQVFVDGDSMKDYLVAIVVPFEERLRKLASDLHGKGQGSDPTGLNFADLCKDPKLTAAVLDQLRQFGSKQQLNSLENVLALKLTSEHFTVEKGLLTPTLKARRPRLKVYYEDDIANLYASAKNSVKNV